MLLRERLEHYCSCKTVKDVEDHSPINYFIHHRQQSEECSRGNLSRRNTLPYHNILVLKRIQKRNHYHKGNWQEDEKPKTKAKCYTVNRAVFLNKVYPLIIDIIPDMFLSRTKGRDIRNPIKLPAIKCITNPRAITP